MTARNQATWMYPAIEPNKTGYLKVSPIHEIYYEEVGNPKGKPVVFVHGGPGGGVLPSSRQFFNPQKYRIVLFDQRGAGKSKPHANLVENTTWHLIEDMEKLRKHLNIEKWQVFGGSWGSSLSLAYAQTHPERVSELVLRGIFLVRDEEVKWMYQEGASFIFPESWQNYIEVIPPAERGNLLQAFAKRLFDEANPTEQIRCARAWSAWEGAIIKLIPDPELVESFGEDQFAIALARIECHYFVNKGFFNEKTALLKNIDKIRHIPTVIVHGRYDICTPVKNAYDLHELWPEAELFVIPDTGHLASENGNARALVAATDKFSSL